MLRMRAMLFWITWMIWLLHSSISSSRSSTSIDAWWGVDGTGCWVLVSNTPPSSLSVMSGTTHHMPQSCITHTHITSQEQEGDYGVVVLSCYYQPSNKEQGTRNRTANNAVWITRMVVSQSQKSSRLLTRCCYCYFWLLTWIIAMIVLVLLPSTLSYSSTTLYICISASSAWGGPQFIITCQEASCRTAQWAVVLQPPAHSSS